MLARQYFPINEDMACTAQNANSFRDYVAGSATAEYRAQVDRVYDVVDEIAARKPHLLERAARKADRYSRKLAEYYNNFYRNEASCPSLLICGGSNFPVRKKEKQNNRRDLLNQDWQRLENCAQEIERLLIMEQPILSNDENALELLEEKLVKLMQLQEQMKAVNAYYCKHKTLAGCAELTDDMRYEIEASWARGWYVGKPYPAYELSNNSANIRRIKQRIAKLEQEKSRGSQEKALDDVGIMVKENIEDMRIQLFFANKPEPEVRDILKQQAFRWSPRNGCWQRQLTDNARYAAKQIVKKIRERNQ